MRILCLLLLAAPLHAQTPVKTAAAATGDVHRWITIPGGLRANQQVTLHSKIAGYIGAVRADYGDTVKAGDLIAKVDVPELEAELKKLEAEVKLAELELSRLTAAREKSPDLVVTRELDRAAASLEIAKANAERTRVQIGYASITAPFPGTITQRFLDPGAFVPAANGGTPQNSAIVTLMDVSTMRATAAVPELESSLIRKGLPVKVSLESLPGRTFEGTITRSAGALDTAMRTLHVEADLPNAEGILKPGQYASVKISVEKHTGVLTIPSEALVMEKTNAFIYRIVDGKAKKSPVTAGFNDGVLAEISAGLQAGEKVILAGKLALADGQAVTEAAAKP